jgi:hypothetical protein
MNDVLFALLAIVAGAVFCFAGYRAFRIIIPLWAGFVGFTLGAGIGASLGSDDFLATTASWVVGVLAAIGFAFVAYLFYEVAVTLAMASIGFALGASLMVALDVRWSWLVVLAGVLAGGALAAVAIASNLPAILLLVLTAIGGASAITQGIMLLTGALDTGEFDDPSVSSSVSASGWWFLLFLVIGGAGAVTQARAVGSVGGSMRDTWAPTAQPGCVTCGR